MARKPVASEWDAVATELAKDRSSGAVQYLKAGDTVLKLTVPEGTPKTKFFAKFNDLDFNGKDRICYLISCVITEADEDGVADTTAVKYLKITPGVLDSIIKKFRKGWDLMSADGQQIVITKLTKMPWYEVDTIKSEFDASEASWPENDLFTEANEEAERVAERADDKPVAKVKGRRQDEPEPF